jgi:AcrR family transcriptional regulator
MKTKDTPCAKERILEAAQRLFAEKGFWGASVQDITDAANVNKAMLFYYFKSKENLYCSLIGEILETICNALIERAHAYNEPLQKFTSIMEIYSELCFQPQNFEIFKIIFQDIMGPEDRVKVSIRENVNKILQFITSVIEEGIAAGVFKKVDPHFTALSILGMCYIFARHRLLMGEQSDVDEIVPHIQSVILEGIKC